MVTSRHISSVHDLPKVLLWPGLQPSVIVEAHSTVLPISRQRGEGEDKRDGVKKKELGKGTKGIGTKMVGWVCNRCHAVAHGIVGWLYAFLTVLVLLHRHIHRVGQKSKPLVIYQ